MSSTSSAASAASASDLSGPGCEPSRSARSSPTAEPCSGSTGPLSESIATLPISPQNGCAPTATDELTLSAVGSLARTCHPAAERSASLESGPPCGGSSSVSFASWDPDTSSWRTFQTCFLEGLATFSETWPRSGMTRSGIAYPLPSLGCRRPGSAYGLLPTLTAGDAKGSRNATAKGRSLSDGMTMTDWLWLNVGRGMLAPGSAEQMMGYPIGWTELAASETPSRRRSRKSSAAPSCKEKG